MYPKEKMEEVVKVLSTEYSNLRIFFFGGGKEEKQILNTWAAKYKGCTCASEVLHGLNEELVLMSHLDTMISMDSANMHLASLVGTRVVASGGLLTLTVASSAGTKKRKMPCKTPNWNAALALYSATNRATVATSNVCTA